MATICIDFDGTIHDWEHPKPGMKMGPPMEGARGAIITMKSAGHTIVIFSVRGDRPGHIQEWMKFYDIPFDHVTNMKLPCDAYIDDRAIGFRGDWNQSLHDLKELIGPSKSRTLALS